MAMLISKFHRLIQSRLLWASFLVIIIFTFVVWGMQSPGASKKAREAMAAGKLYGKFVSQAEFQKAYFNTYMSVVLMVGRPLDMTRDLDKELRAAAWRRLVTLQKAAELGMTASDDEVLATIQHHSGFADEGRFNPNRYAAFVQNMLAPMGFSSAQFENHIRQEIVMQKLQAMIRPTILVSPVEIMRAYSSLTDKFTVDYVVITTNDVMDEVKVTEEDAERFYKADPKFFTIPEQIRIKYVQIPVDDYLPGVATNITEEDALAYYDEHIDDFTVTNEVAVAEKDSKDEEISTNETAEATSNVVAQVTNKVTTLAFDQVKTNIMTIMQHEAARDLAAETATDFVVSLAPDRDYNSVPFEEAASNSARKLEVKEAGPFSLRDKVVGTDAPSFNRMAFALRKTPDEYFSDAIIGSNNVYVIALEEKIPARVPEYKEVAGEVMAAATENAIADALAKKAPDVRDAITKALAKDKTFASALKPFKLKAEKLEKFSATSRDVTNDYFDVIVSGILTHNEGEVTDVLPTENGEVLVAYVAKRTPGSTAGMDTLKPQIIETIKRQRMRLLYDEWQDYLLKEAGFEEKVADDVIEDEENAEESPTEGEQPVDDGESAPEDTGAGAPAER